MKITITTILILISIIAFSQPKKTKQINGVVEWFDSTKGIGFIKTLEGNEVFINFDNLPIKNKRYIILVSGQNVIFDIKETEKGVEAYNLKII